jgi:hypothetical protein
MLFLAFFADFRRENGIFRENQCYDPIFSQFSSVSSQKRQLLCDLKSKYWL